MSQLELKRKKLELKRVEIAKEEQRFKIEECLHQIELLKEHIKIQEKREFELANEIKELEKAEKARSS